MQVLKIRFSIPNTFSWSSLSVGDEGSYLLNSQINWLLSIMNSLFLKHNRSQLS